MRAESSREEQRRNSQKKRKRYREREHSVTVLEFHVSAQKPHAYKVEHDVSRTEYVHNGEPARVTQAHVHARAIRRNQEARPGLRLHVVSYNPLADGKPRGVDPAPQRAARSYKGDYKD